MNKYSIHQKVFAIILSISLIFALILSGCNVNNIDENSTTSDPQESTVSTPESSNNTEPQTPEDTTNPPGGSGPSKPEEPSEHNTNQDNTPTEPESSDETEPEASEPESSDPTQSETVTYLDYYKMSAEEQQAFINSFESLDAFFAWLSAAQQEYEESRTPIEGTTPLAP